MTGNRPLEGSYEEIYWLRGFEAGVDMMRTEKPVNMLSDLQRRHMKAFIEGDEPLRKKLFEAIEWFVWAFPDVEQEHSKRYNR